MLKKDSTGKVFYESLDDNNKKLVEELALIEIEKEREGSSPILSTQLRE
jgi:hypothetical protein